MVTRKSIWLRGRDLNPRPLGYEPNELPGCSTPRHVWLSRNSCAAQPTNSIMRVSSLQGSIVPLHRAAHRELRGRSEAGRRPWRGGGFVSPFSDATSIIEAIQKGDNMTGKHVASLIATAALALWPALSVAQTPPPSTSSPSSTPPSTPTRQPRPGTTQPPPSNPSGGDPSVSRGSENAKQKIASADHKFAMDAAMGGLAEVQLGKLAADHASNADVKKFAQRMVDDHDKANDELSNILKQKGMTPPTDLKGREKATYDRLSKLNGPAFDRAYMSEMVKDHEKDVKEFERESTSGKDPDLKAFAAKTLPTLQDHLKMARDTQSKLGTDTGH
jgi:putative membrane protein